MPTTKPLPLYSAGDVTRSLDYLRDASRPSHLAYKIHSTDTGSDVDFVRQLEHHVSWLNSEVSLAHRVKTWAYWVFVNFPPGSHLDASERAVVSKTMTAGLGANWSRAAWHVNQIRGCADFNLILPAVVPGSLPSLRRFVVLSLWSASKFLLERTIHVLNVERRRHRRTLLLDVHDVQLRNAVVDGTNIAVGLSEAARQSSTAISEETLPMLLAQVGLHPREWLIHGRYLFLRRNRKKTRAVRLDVLLAAAQNDGRTPAIGPTLTIDERDRNSDAPEPGFA